MTANLSKQSEETVNPARRASMADYSESHPLAAPVVRPEHRESDFTRLIEQQTAKIPSHVFLFMSVSAMAASLALELAGRTRPSRFVGMWAPSLLILGVYNKLVKTFGAS